MPADDEFLTTGDAADILRISRSTVSRKFDRGELRGRVNPVTGERLISRASAAAFMRRFNLTHQNVIEARYRVVSASPDEEVLTVLRQNIGDEPRLALETVTSGCDALLACARATPDLLVIDSALSDVSIEELIRSVRAAASAPVRVACIGPIDEVRQLIAQGAEALLERDALADQDVLEAIYALLGIEREAPGKEPDYGYQRQWRRKPVNVRAAVEVYLLSAPRVRMKGTAVLADISRGGALLTEMALASGGLPLEPFRLTIRVGDPPLNGLKAHAQVVRFRSGDPVQLAVQFTKVSAAGLALIDAFIEAGAPLA